jgi:hypothetical protein
MAVRPVLACGVALVAASSALAGTPLVRTLVTERGVGHVTIGAGTDELHSRLWLQRIGGSGVAHGSGDVSCQKAGSSGSSGQSTMYAFSLPPNGRVTMWRSSGTESCVVTASVRGRGRLALALRGY